MQKKEERNLYILVSNDEIVFVLFRETFFLLKDV